MENYVLNPALVKSLIFPSKSTLEFPNTLKPVQIMVDVPGFAQAKAPSVVIKELLSCLGHDKRFTQLDLISAYHRVRNWEGNKWKTLP